MAHFLQICWPRKDSLFSARSAAVLTGVPPSEPPPTPFYASPAGLKSCINELNLGNNSAFCVVTSYVCLKNGVLANGNNGTMFVTPYSFNMALIVVFVVALSLDNKVVVSAKVTHSLSSD